MIFRRYHFGFFFLLKVVIYIVYFVINLLFLPQPCPDGLDFRAVQCSAYNDQPYDGETVEWHPYYDEESPCTLMCVDSKGRVEEMAPRVRDGTRCRLGSLDMCIDGVCQVRSRNGVHAVDIYIMFL